MRGPRPRPVLERIKDRVVLDENGCHVFVGALNQGYGVIGVGSMRDGTRRNAHVHRTVMDELFGPLSSDEDVHHACPGKPNRACCNPDHLEVVAKSEHPDEPSVLNSKKTHCLRGHPFNEQNTYITPKGHRGCRTCLREASLRYYYARGPGQEA